ncbi:CsgG/HfaB family protein [Geomonas anaerohicana]|uniref:Curli production assembly/transport protein CsgG n=1 Tax=Geomonas anaerohicana TaxID=2798583 RepID=A0ABS0YC76_9BACT|nr:CsgG/HfaB family protein [Geomonas anaerohicana]MBJ6749913.1 curli production assembly/transport protein CsgG [Geomonas anaerohicana]
MKRTKMLFTLVIVLLALGMSGCATEMSVIGTGRATPGFGGYATSTHKALMGLPKPKQRIPVAVYKFRDQTGQYKYSSNVSSFSTAVTQGSTTMLIKALEDSGWFVPIEREGLNNLLTERKIIRQTSESYAATAKARGEVPPQIELPPLMYAGIMLEGGIISYDTNLVTSAMGGKLTGIGASLQYRQDQLSIFLRAVSTKNGVILKTVNTTKTVLSRELDAGVFKFISIKDLLEAEIGFSTNEPAAICTVEAIEKSVFDLIVEGILAGLWELKDPADIGTPLIKKYLEEREGIEVELRNDALQGVKATKISRK